MFDYPPGEKNPSTLASLSPVTQATVASVSAAVERARDAQRTWANQSLKARSALAIALGKLIVERRGAVADVLAAETGRHTTECLINEVVTAANYAKVAVSTAERALAPEKIKLSPLEYPGKRALIEAVPRGVIGVIAPWNYPLGNFMKPLFPALLSGNGLILKPSEHTPRTGALLGQLCDEIFPRGLVQVVQGAGDVGAALLDAGVDGLAFTGSVSTGRTVSMAAAARMVPCSVELGGKDAAIVLADCDLDRTAAGIAQWSMHNAGQNCAAIERVYVEESIAKVFLSKLSAAVGRLRVAGDDKYSDLGPLQNPNQFKIVKDQVSSAVAQGAKVEVGGQPTGVGLGFQPTVLSGCNDKMTVYTEETFGPVVTVTVVADENEAIHLANESDFGLNGSVWTQNITRGEAIARRLKVGVALVNNHAITGTLAQLPWTGTGHTGTGVAASRHAYPTFVRRRVLFTDSARKPDPWWLPIDETTEELAQLVARMQLGSLTAPLKLLGIMNERVRRIRRLING